MGGICLLVVALFRFVSSHHLMPLMASIYWQVAPIS